MVTDVEQKIYEIAGFVFGISPSALDLNSSTETLKNWDSAKHIDFILALEDEFKIEFDEEKVLEMLSLELVLKAVKELKT
tara:strand:- start:525 stop:764 length:240 start_codon:yes stop_codon:yes gene_type:complete